jgi:hypothetical protein
MFEHTLIVDNSYGLDGDVQLSSRIATGGAEYDGVEVDWVRVIFCPANASGQATRPVVVTISQTHTVQTHSMSARRLAAPFQPCPFRALQVQIVV